MGNEIERIVDTYLTRSRGNKWVLLSDIADEINCAVKKKRHWKRKEQLHNSLYDYEQYVHGARWVSADEMTGLIRGLGGKFLCVKNPYYTT